MTKSSVEEIEVSDSSDDGSTKPRPSPRPRPGDTESAIETPAHDDLSVTVAAASGAGDSATRPTDAEEPVHPNRLRIAREVSWSRWPAVVAALVVVMLLVTDVLLVIRKGERDDRIHRLLLIQSASEAAVTAANADVPLFLSYNYASLDSDFAKSLSVVTGAFRAEFAQLLTTVIRPAAASQKIATVASVKGVAVVQGSASDVSLLVFIDQSTTNSSTKTPRIDGSRATIVMTKVNGTWLISKLTPV